MKRVAVTGIGAVTPLGNSFSSAWEAANKGVTGIGRITRFDASFLPWSIAGELKEFSWEEYLSPKEMRRLDPFVHYAVAAAVMAAKEAGLLSSRTPPLTARSALTSGSVIIGSSRGGISTIERELLKLQRSPVPGHRSRFSPYLMPATTINMAASSVAQKLGIGGHCLGISNACSSGTNAVGEAFRLIKSGYSPFVIAGGAEAPICKLCVEGYGTAGALSARREFSEGAPDTPRPFDRERDGFVLSEGACVLVLEEYEHARKRDAKIYGEIIGYGNTTDAFHMTKPDAGGESAAMSVAMKEAAVTPDEVDYINTHGTGTRLGDRAEAEAIRAVFGRRASRIPASALKSMTGHMLAASGALEIAATLMSMKEGVIPPTINLDEQDPECDIHVTTEKKKADIHIAISNSFGFGGVNAVIVLKKV
jgi:3-oxoacyl-[acyl-carrier-protein] synthase II